MARFVRMMLDDGSTVLLEETGPAIADLAASAGGPQAAGSRAAIPVAQWEPLAKAAAALCATVRQQVSSDEISLEIGAALSGEVGWFIAKSSAQATVKLTLTWRNDQSVTVG
jgi:hypothetical protein